MGYYIITINYSRQMAFNMYILYKPLSEILFQECLYSCWGQQQIVYQRLVNFATSLITDIVIGPKVPVSPEPL